MQFNEGDDAPVPTLPGRPVKVTWVRVDDEMPQHAVLSGPNLFINNLNKTDNGTYRCEAYNVVGKAHSDYTLYVYGTCDAALLPQPPHTLLLLVTLSPGLWSSGKPTAQLFPSRT